VHGSLKSVAPSVPSKVSPFLDVVVGNAQPTAVHYSCVQIPILTSPEMEYEIEKLTFRTQGIMKVCQFLWLAKEGSIEHACIQI
jgi:hypothetical protein